ncbi:MAG: universal stress protein [Desulfobacteraceae bacterium]|nr:MAG: universal stress protein [Desulfobacteraceae bacterium]
MFRNILILFENHQVCSEALTYGREFAARMDARVTFLMLKHMRFAGRTLLVSKRSALSRSEDKAAQILSQAAEPFIQHGLEVSSAFRVGEPAQELLKFLADRQPFQAIIWGSAMDLPAKGHWIGRVSIHMECPLLTVSKKGRG